MAVKMGPKCFPEIEELAKGKPLTNPQTFHALCDFIDARLDCADFRLSCILRALLGYHDQLGTAERERAKSTVLGFRYWMDEPGNDSMCFWSENHQILFASCEYLAGHLYREETFSNNGMNGEQRMAHARPRILQWLRDRTRYGYVEWHSNVYYEEDAAPLSLLVDFAPETEIQTGAEMALDLLFLDMALHSWNGLFCATSGRCYEDQKLHPLKADTLELSDLLAGTGHVSTPDFTRLTAHLHLGSYTIPPVLEEIARSQRRTVVTTSMGLDLPEVLPEFPENRIETTGMFLWAMEAFTNPRAISMAGRIMHSWNLEGNRFLSGLKPFANPVLRALHIPQLISRVLAPSTNGVAIQRANTYTVRTPQYMLSTAVRYHPGEFGDQHHIWQATLDDDIAVLTTHPGAPMFDDNARNFSPSYWVGNGINPHAVQHQNVMLAIYRTGGRRGYLERSRVHFTHAWFPFDRFDQSALTGHIAFGATSTAYIALIGALPLSVHAEEPNELVQSGKNSAWVCEIGTAEEWGSFDRFKEVTSSSSVEFSGRTLAYRRPGTAGVPAKSFHLTYQGEFRVDGKAQTQEYQRLDSEWVSAPRNPEQLAVHAGDAELHHDYRRWTRRVAYGSS
jgi:hypothetical protein